MIELNIARAFDYVIDLIENHGKSAYDALNSAVHSFTEEELPEWAADELEYRVLFGRV